ncbi:GYF domain-containing protein [Cryptosporidium muris RN66]|uniref:GYF domain-containing protein n=1 Tax=Cryptosporidium muris (strain RN66) TaxID=441375 RepID=B6AHX6_CRYMR|nr:GYF domain-containing protein [Cryptosporidium muris RN66]EEA07817.1 GYF domain-containing protein [Cryptosporidium muris RN66]|eukprot:XP_002142166.1 GYF domain-containing protein [Cryptosporidium muris RN66]
MVGVIKFDRFQKRMPNEGVKFHNKAIQGLRKEKISNQRNLYYYKDDSEKLIGPFTASKLIEWVNQGYFDQKGSTLVKREHDTDYVTLKSILPNLLMEEQKSLINRLCNLDPLHSENTQFDVLSQQISAIDPIGTIPANDIYLQEATCDLDVILMPNEKSKMVFEMTMNKINATKSKKAITLTSTLGDSELARVKERTADNNLETNSGNMDLINIADDFVDKHSKFIGRYCGDSQNIPSPLISLRIPVHSNLLGLASPVMRVEINQLMELRQEFNEQYTLNYNSEDIQTKLNRLKASLVRPEYKIKAIYPEAVRVLLLFIYGHTTCLRGADPYLMLTVLHEARRFKIQLLEEELFEMLNSPANLEAIVQMSSVAECLEMANLVESAVYILADCAQSLFKGAHLALSSNVLLQVIKSERVLMAEMDIFLAVHMYVLQRERSVGLFSDSKDKKLNYYKYIRFEQMSPSDLKKIRTPDLDSLLLDAALNKLLGNEVNGRLVPWKSNTEFSTNKISGLYPIELIRKTSFAGKYKWAWTLGDYRLVSDMIWQVKLCKTYMGRVRLGVCCRSWDANNLSQVPKVFYYDFMENCFGSAFLTNDLYNLRSRISCANNKTRDKFILESDTEIQIRLNINRYNLVLTVTDITKSEDKKVTIPATSIAKSKFSASHTFGHDCIITPIGFTKRPFLETANFVEMLDDGDKLRLS